MRYWEVRKEVDGTFRELCHEFGMELIKGHVHICLNIPPRYAVAQAVGRLKEKSAI